MKRITTLLLLTLSCIATASFANVPFKKVVSCESDLFNGEYCSKKNIAQYKNALKTMKPNFNKKYILLNTGSSNSLEFIALDTLTGIAYPLNLQYTGWENNAGKTLKKPTFSFSLNQEKLCLTGSQYDGDHPGTHETYSNIKNCFVVQTERGHTSFESTHKDQVQYDYDEKDKTWKPFQN